ncbi:hypothetical protein DINM_001079 [Dirofilaria immitis]|nr:hypothetical protein [Dirofilaria immitis]
MLFKQPKNLFQHLVTTLGLNRRHDGTEPQIGFASIGMDWVSLICLVSSAFLTDLSNPVSVIWTIYLLICSYYGLRAGRWQSYPYAIAYCIMCAIQSLVYLSTMCWLFHSFNAFANAQPYDLIYNSTSDAVMILALGEVISIIGTIFTGIFGLVGCCRGFGQLLHAQEKMILDYQNVLVGAYDKAYAPKAVLDSNEKLSGLLSKKKSVSCLITNTKEFIIALNIWRRDCWET